MDLLRMNWNATIEYCEQLASKINFKPEIIVALSRGGLVPARILSDILGVDVIGVIGIQFYKNMKPTSSPKIIQELSLDVEGKRVLIVDDVADSGRSLTVAREHLLKKGVKEIKTATIHYKPNSMFKPDYYVMTTTSWIVYPWEQHEIARELKIAQYKN